MIELHVRRTLQNIRIAAALAATLALAGCSVPGALQVQPGGNPGLSRGIATADSLVQVSVGERFPGAVLLVAKDGRVLLERAYGFAQLEDFEGNRLSSPPPMRTTTLFDLASVTKVMATTFAVMLLQDRGALVVDAPVSRYLPDFTGPHLDSITVRHLLTHSSGLVQWQPLYYAASTPTETYRAIEEMPLGWGVGEGRHYSDLGFMLLGYIIEKVADQPLDAFLERELYQPLGLRTVGFRPLSRGHAEIAATEPGNGYEHHMVHDTTFGYDYAGDPMAWNGWRRYVLRGETNDGNAWYAHAGLAGHAGLFSTAADLRVLLDLLNGRGSVNGRRYLGAGTVERFLTRDRYGHHLGWMAPTGLPEGSFSHTGFTGTYVLGVPRYGLSVVLLTNRQNLGTDERGYFPDLGPLQQAISAAIVRGAEEDAARLPR